MHQRASHVLLALVGAIVLGQPCGFARAEGVPADPPRVKFSTWQGGAVAALSLSFDDWSPDNWSRGMKLWEEFGYKVTIGFTMAKLDKHPDGVAHLQRAFDAGHEIANHSQRHENLLTLRQSQVRFDLGQCNDFLLSNVQGLKRIYTVIYPEEQFDDETIQTLEEMGYLFARAGPQGINDIVMLNDPFKPPFLHLFSWCNQNDLTVSQWNNAVDWAISRGGWLIEQCHGIGEVDEPGVGWSPRPESEYRKHFDYIKKSERRIWVAPIGTVGRYILERNALKPQVVAYTQDSLEFDIEGDLDFAEFDVPLTVEIELPPLWLRATATQAEHTLECTISPERVLLFDVLPGGGKVLVKQSGVAGRS